MTVQSTPNPLISITHPLPFDQIQAEYIESAVDALLTEARVQKEALESMVSPTYEVFFKGMDLMGASLEDCLSVCSQLESLLGDPDIRSAYQNIQPRVSAFYAQIPFSGGLYKNIKRIAQSDAFTTLSADRRRYVQKTLDSFKRSGAELGDLEKSQLERIEVRLSEITLRFGQNVVDETDAFELLVTDEADLSGLPESAKAMARLAAESKDLEGWRFTLQGPSFIAVMTYADSRTLREEIYRAYVTRATSGERDNTALISEILSLRKEKATMLGYRDASDLFLESRMVKSGQNAYDFVEKLSLRTSPFFEDEKDELFRFCREELGWIEDIESWDLAYFSEKMRKAHCDFDAELLKPYFEVNSVIQGMFTIVEKLYGVKVKPVEDLPTWHPDVSTYHLLDHEGQLKGVFYADLFPREGKQGGAWMCPLLYADGAQPHVGLICANFTPPIEGRSLITHREVETLFHEFGHLLHHLLSEVSIRSQAGTNVAWDFVELPSQIMENWCWEREALSIFARHYETQEPIPDALFERLTRTRTFRQATGQMRQLSFATVDLKLHREYSMKTDGDLILYAKEVMTPFSPTPVPEDYSMITGFTHLFSSPIGYAAAYYSYKWAEVLDADAFNRFRREGLFSPVVGDAFLKSILSRGDSEDPLSLYQNFMGREPDLEPLFERMGLGVDQGPDRVTG
jgi:oligopeptidase A